MYLSQLTIEQQAFHRLDLSPRNRSVSSQGNDLNGIVPWGPGEKILGNISSMKPQTKIQKNHQNASRSEFQHGNSLHFIESPQKGRTNRSNLGKFQKANKNNKTNQQFHLNTNYIQFKQKDRKLELENQNQLFFKANQKINIKDFSSLENNFFIKSYFFPSNVKPPSRRIQSESLDCKKRKQNKNLKEVQPSTFLAIKSVDLKEKFSVEQKESDEKACPLLQREQFCSTYRTISVLSSRRKQRSKQIHENYQLKGLNGQVRTHNKTIESTKQSSRQNCDSLREKYKALVEKKIKKDKLSQSNEFISISSSFIKGNKDQYCLHSQEPKIVEEKVQPISKGKKINLSKHKQTMIDRIKKLKPKSDHQNFTQCIQQKPIQTSKKSPILQNYSSIQTDRPYKKAYTQNLMKMFQGNKNHLNRLIIYDRQFQGDRTTFCGLNKSVFLLNDSKEKTFILK